MIARRHLLASLGWAAASGLGLTAMTRDASANKLHDALRKISNGRAELRTLQATFRQTREIGLLATKVVSTGKLTLAMPNRMRWDLFAPDDVSYWLGPDGLAMRNRDGVTKVGKTSAKRFAAVLGDLLILLGGNIRKLQKRYAIEVSGNLLSLTPKAKTVAKHVRRIELKMAGDHLARAVTIIEANGDNSVIEFGPYTKNAAVEPEYMQPPS